MLNFRVLGVFCLAVLAWTGDVPTVVQQAVEAADRDAEEQARDENRRPGEVLAFWGIGTGMRVADLSSGAGYYTDILCRLVGSEGQVIAHNVPFVIQRFSNTFAEGGPWDQRFAQPHWSNATKLISDLDDPQLMGDLDAAIMVLFYHDTYWQKTNREKMNRAIFAALKPGGVYGIVDHSAEAGSGERDCETLHRVDEELVKKEILAAGFQLAATSDLLRHEEDTRDYNVFRDFQTNRDHTDRFVLKFVKPK